MAVQAHRLAIGLEGDPAVRESLQPRRARLGGAAHDGSFRVKRLCMHLLLTAIVRSGLIESWCRPDKREHRP